MATYYVKTGGSDSANGLSDANAWATVAKVEATVTSGDIVYFRSQDTWTDASGDQLLLATAGVTYDGRTYGTGTRATFQATGVLGEAVINIYQSNVTVRGFNLDGNSQGTSGIWVNYNATANISGITIDDVVAHDFTEGSYHGHGIAVSPHAGHTVSNVTITNCVCYNNGQIGIMIYPGWDVVGNYIDTITVRGCEVYNNGASSPNNRYGIMIKDDVRNAIIEYNYIHDNHWFGIKFETEVDSQYSITQWTNVTVRYNIISGNYNWGIYFVNDGLYTGMSTDIYGNLIFGNGTASGDSSYGGGGIVIWNNDWSSSTTNFYNNTILSLSNPLATRYGFWNRATGTPTINFKNNIVYTDDHTTLADTGNKLTHTNNLIYRTSGAAAEHVNNGTSYNRAGVTTWEASAQNTDPTFKNMANLPTAFSGVYGTNMIPNNDGLSMESGPALNNGAAVGAGYNGAINLSGTSGGLTRPLGASWDIGAYEYNPGITPLPIKMTQFS